MTGQEQQLRKYLLKRAEGAPTTAELRWRLVHSGLDGPARSQATRWLPQALAASVAAAIVVVGVAIVTSPVDPPSQQASPDAKAWPGTREQGSETRAVGSGEVQVLVPSTWDTDDVKCGTPLSDTVIFAGSSVRTCLIVDAPRVSSLEIVPRNLPQARAWLERGGSVQQLADGPSVTIVETDDVEEGTHLAAIIPEGGDVVFVIESSSEDTVVNILESVAAIPDGYVAVPFRPDLEPSQNLDALKAIGLKPEVTNTGGSGEQMEMDPPAGSVVPAGSAVTVRMP